MKFTLLLQIVLRNMLSRKLRFVFTLLASAIAVGSTIFLFSLGYGLEEISTEQLVKSDALLQIEVSSTKPTEIKLNDEMVSQIKSIAEVSSVASSTSLAGKIIIDDKSLDSPFYGASESYYPLAGIDLKKGRFPVPEEINYLLLSEKTVSALGTTSDNLLNKKLNYKLIIPPVLGQQDNSDYIYEATVIGIIANQKSAFAYVSGADAKLAGAESYSVLKVKADNKNDIIALRKKVENLGLKTIYVGDKLQEMNRFFGYFRLILGGFALIGVAIALFGMFNTLTVSLMERIKEISLLKILGSKEKIIFWMFALESLIFGLLGFLLGIVLFLLSKAIVLSFFSILANRLGNTSVNIFDTPTILVVIVFLVTMLLGFLAGLFPARRALKVNPLDIQRFE